MFWRGCNPFNPPPPKSAPASKSFLLVPSSVCALFTVYMWINLCSHNYVGPTGDRNKYVLVQYMFEGPERQINVKPHENSKGTTPYYHTILALHHTRR